MSDKIAPYISLALVLVGIVLVVISPDNVGMAFALACFTWGVIVEVKLTNDTILSVLKGSGK